MVQRMKVNQEQSKQQQQQKVVVVDSLNQSDKSFKLISMLLLGSVLSLVLAGNVALAGQGCPFDDGSCREYCNQQGCNMGYCGHFAWIQCICRKCGDEWSWYDKVRYNPDKTVNQTELDSLKLNGTAPIILTNSSDQQQQQPSQATPSQSNKPVAIENKQQTLTTLLIPDLSETNGKLELNDIPDENSDKFLDYLAKNHEKLVQATAARSSDSSISAASQQQQQQPQQQTQNNQNKQIIAGGIDLEEEHENQEEQDNQAPNSDETIEIQISTSNNNSNNNDAGQSVTSTLPKVVQQTQPAATSTSASTSSQTPSASQKQQQEQQQEQQQSESGSESESESPRQAMSKLLKMAIIERASEEIV